MKMTYTVRKQREKQQGLNERVLNLLKANRQLTAKEIAQRLNANLSDVYKVLNVLKEMGIAVRDQDMWLYNPIHSTRYVDWDGNLKKLVKLHDSGIFAALIGPSGTGKTQCVMALAEITEKPIYAVNLSLRTKELHLIGRLDAKDGEIVWKKGPVPLSMEEGAILYLDEINQAEPDILIRLDECLDDRRELNFEGQHIKAKEGWYVCCSMNPLDHPGTKELPPQILTRFPARLEFRYPPLHYELNIAKKHVPLADSLTDTLERIIECFHKLREGDLPFKPTLRETITAAKLLKEGFTTGEVLELTVFSSLVQWGRYYKQQAQEVAHSLDLI